MRVIVNSAMLVVSAVAALTVILRNYYRWKTDTDGLTAIGLLGSKRIRWQDISESTTRTNWIGETIYRLRAGGIVLRIPYLIPSNGWQESVLIASVWQHLRRYGKSDGLLMSANTQSLWDEIPAELPHDLEAISP